MKKTGSEPLSSATPFERARLLADVAKQRVRIAKEELKRARKRLKEAKREARRARKHAAVTRKAWKRARRKGGAPSQAKVAVVKAKARAGRAKAKTARKAATPVQKRLKARWFAPAGAPSRPLPCARGGQNAPRACARLWWSAARSRHPSRRGGPVRGARSDGPPRRRARRP